MDAASHDIAASFLSTASHMCLQVTLMGLWLVPAIISLRFIFWRFLLVSSQAVHWGAASRGLHLSPAHDSGQHMPSRDRAAQLCPYRLGLSSRW